MQEQMMNLEKIINTSIDEIKQKMLSICENEYNNDLDFETAIGFVSKMKDLISQLGCQVVKEYFESRDTFTDSITINKKRYLNKGKSNKEIVTSLGRIVISRNYYQHRSGGNSLFPLDEKLGVNHEMIMPDVKEILLYSSAFNTPEESSRMLSKCSFISLHPTQIKRAISGSNDFLELNGSKIMDKVREQEEAPDSDILVCSLDGVNVLLNENGNKKGRPTQRPIKEKLSLSAYKNAMCGSVAHYKTIDENGIKVPKRISTTYIARMPENRYPTFKFELEKEIQYFEAAPNVTKLVITDAHKSISGYLKNNPAFKDYKRIIDFYHASEHLSHLAEAIHGKSSVLATKWYRKYRTILKNSEDGVSKVIRSIEYYLKNNSLNKSRKEQVNKHLNYFKKHKKYMAYSYYLEKGWPIGSGVIEAACKSVVKQRMCRSGQRWSIKGGQAVLNLRATVKSGRWNSFWNEYSESFYNKMVA
jgi:hypothetical protein